MASRPSRARAACAETPVRRICTSEAVDIKAPGPRAERPHGDAGLHVQGEDALYAVFFQHAALRHEARAAAGFLRRLEDGQHVAGQLAPCAARAIRRRPASSPCARRVRRRAFFRGAQMQKGIPCAPEWAARPCRSGRRWSPPARRRNRRRRRSRPRFAPARPAARAAPAHTPAFQAGQIPPRGCGAAPGGGGEWSRAWPFLQSLPFCHFTMARLNPFVRSGKNAIFGKLESS